MTFTIQEVPEHWDISDIQMYDMGYEWTSSDSAADQDNSRSSCLMQQDEIKVEDPCMYMQYQPTTTASMIASPPMNMPMLGETYNTYVSSPQVFHGMPSPPNTYVDSPADSSMIASRSMNMPMLGETYNTYVSSPQVFHGMPSPPNTYVDSPADSSMRASPPMNMPMLGETYNTYVSSPQVVHGMSSPSNTYVDSPADSSMYSASPVEFLQQTVPLDGYSYPAHVVPEYDYGYYSYGGNDFIGKRRRRDDELTHDEYEKRRSRRQRNKEAAQRCRNRRADRIEELEQETSEIEAQNEKVEIDIKQLQAQIKELKDILQGHVCKGSGGNPPPTTQCMSGQAEVKSEL